MTKAIGPLGGVIYDMIREGWEDEEIVRMLPNYRAGRVRAAIAIARDKLAMEPPKKRGPWPVSYVRQDGETVYRVGSGHDVPESSLHHFGFEI